jgi:hypothetical protein
MIDFLEWINFDDLPALIVLICLLWVTAGQMTKPSEWSNRWVRRTAACTFLAYAASAAYAWQPSGPADLLCILLRGLLAAGLVSGLASIALPLSHAAGTEIISAMKTNCSGPRDDARRRGQEEHETQAARERERRAEAERARRAQHAEVERRRIALERATAERERHAKTDEARAMPIRFYDENRERLRDVLPEDLFRAQLQARFPESITPEQAWKAAEEMIAAMLPLVAKAREREEQIRQEERNRQLEEEQRTRLTSLTAWYEDQKRQIEGQLPPGREREDIIDQLWDRYDELVKQTLKELKP